MDAIHVDVNIVDGLELDTEAFKQWRNGEFGMLGLFWEDGNPYNGWNRKNEQTLLQHRQPNRPVQ